MQEICKIEQPTSPPTTTLLSPPINPKTLKDLMHIITKLLFEGQESAQIIRSFLIEQLGLKVKHHNQVDIDHHCLVTFNSLKNALTLLKTFDFDQEDVIRKRKLDCTNINESLDHCKAEDHGRVTSSTERRGCYKRRRNGQTWTVEATGLVDDGHAWRKYGQKDILNTDYPRNYYRCTHKHDQKCEATKQVQQISKNPTKYNIIYNGEHTCSNLHKTSSIMIDPEENSSIISFETHNNNYPTVKNSLNSCSFFPSTAFPNNNQHAMVKQEHTLIKQELPISPSGLSGTHSTLQYSSSSDNLPSSSDLTSSTPASDQGDSYGFDLDEDIFFNLYMDDHTLFHLDDIMKC